MNKRKAIVVVILSFMTLYLSAQEVKYEIKSAIIKKEVVAMGQKFEAVTYIDDFGQKESAEITLKNGIADGVDKHIRTIADGSSVINVDLDLNVANRMNLPDKPINYLQLTPEIREKYKIEETGEEKITGKLCQKYSFEVTQMGQTMQIKTWVWKGIVLKSEMSGNGMVVSIETATEIQEDVDVPADKLIVPEGITITG